MLYHGFFFNGKFSTCIDNFYIKNFVALVYMYMYILMALTFNEVICIITQSSAHTCTWIQIHVQYNVCLCYMLNSQLLKYNFGYRCTVVSVTSTMQADLHIIWSYLRSNIIPSSKTAVYKFFVLFISQ